MAAISVRSKVQRHFFCVDRDQMISSRDLLIHGPRSGIDNAVSKLIKMGIIYRIVRGVFMRVGGKPPTKDQVAHFKAKAFGREIRKDGLDTTVDLKLERYRHHNPAYCIDAGSSSFGYNGGRIVFKGHSKKRMFLEDVPAALAIRAFWARGEGRLTEHDLKKPQMPWNRSREGINFVLYNRRWMPAWLGDCFDTTAYIGPERNKPLVK